MICLQKASIPAPFFSRPKSALMIDRKCEKRRRSLPAPDSTFREFDLKGDRRVELSLRAPLETTPFLRITGTCSTTAAAASEIEV